MGGRSGMLAIRCPHCDNPPGNEEAMVLFAGHGPWTCVSCGETFVAPKMIPFSELEQGEDQ